MSEKAIQWTEEQLRAIGSRGDVLVTASAGTGKTAVLSNRCVEMIADADDPINVDEMLVLTFTEAAADEMRIRIARTLEKKSNDSRDRRLRKQLLMIDAAEISTIHSFCKRVITENFYEIGIDPSFSLIDSDEQDLIKCEVLEEVVEQAWNDPHLNTAMNKLLSKRNLSDIRKGFTGNILQVSEVLSGVVDKDKWFENALGPAVIDAAKEQKRIVQDQLESCLRRIDFAIEQDSNLLAAAYISSFQKLQTAVEAALGYCKKNDMPSCAEKISEFASSGFRLAGKKGLDPVNKDFVVDIFNDAKKDFLDLLKLASLNSRYEQLVGSQVGLQVRTFVELVKRFENLYEKRKRSLNCLDFSDLERYALKILAAEDGVSPSSVAIRLREKYKSIFIDEYQDVNEVQDAIARLVSKGNNLFVVGDVKQSIYAWRQARPEIFQNHLKNATDKEQAGRELRLDLSSNFRSRREVLDFANHLFGRIMTEQFGGVDYKETSELIYGGDYKNFEEVVSSQGYDRAIELHLLDEDGDFSEDESDLSFDLTESSDAELISPNQKQAGFIAQRIKEMVEGNSGNAEFQVFDKNSKLYRDVGYGDIVILMSKSFSKCYMLIAKPLASII